MAVVVIRLFLLDDHELVRRGIRELLSSEDDLTVVGEASTSAEALDRIPATQPNVAVLDVRLGDGSETSGVEVCREIRSAHPEVACVMLTSFAQDEALFSSIMAGAAGFVLKQIRGSDLVNAIRRVGAGESLLDPAITARVLERLRTPRREVDPLASLTTQERRILDLIAEGRTNRQIGEAMSLAEKTVKNYVSLLLAKLGMRRRTEAAVLGSVCQSAGSSRPNTERRDPIHAVPKFGRANCAELVRNNSAQFRPLTPGVCRTCRWAVSFSPQFPAPAEDTGELCVQRAVIGARCTHSSAKPAALGAVRAAKPPRGRPGLPFPA